MSMQLTQLFRQKNTEALRQALQQQPESVNIGITYLDQGHGPLAHPLHRLCDTVFAGLLTDEQAVRMAEVLIEAGANINGNYENEGSTPLIAAASLHCERLGIYYVEQGADVNLKERNGEATALNWACYCGLNRLTEKLIQAGANINQREPKFNCTPVEWAIHAVITQPQHVMHRQLDCIKAMLKAGADQSLFAERFDQKLTELTKSDTELKALLKY